MSFPGGPEPKPETEPGSEVMPESEPSAGWMNVTTAVAELMNVTGEPEAEPSGGPVPVQRGIAEPVPDWDEAIPVWSEAWPFHMYGIGAMFAALAAVSFVVLVLIAMRKLNRTRMVTPIVAFLVVLGSSRAIFLVGDAYGYKGVYPLVFLQVMGGLALPSLTSAYGLLLYAIMRALRPTHTLSERRVLLQLTAVVTAHFVITVTADIIIGLHYTDNMARVLVIFCQTLFLVWGMALFCTFSWVGVTVFRQLRSSDRLRSGKNSSRASSSSAWKRYSRPLAIIAMATFCGLCVVAVYIYGLVTVYNLEETAKTFPEPWPWWSYQTVTRMLELVMSALILYATVLTPDNQDLLKGNLVGPRRRLSQTGAKLLGSIRKFSTRTLSTTETPAGTPSPQHRVIHPVFITTDSGLMTSYPRSPCPTLKSSDDSACETTPCNNVDVEAARESIASRRDLDYIQTISVDI